MNYYFHFPFCSTRCGYCAFYSMAGRPESMFDTWLDGVEKSLDRHCAEGAETIYIGGGTPSLLSVPRLARLFSILEGYGLLRDCREISIEANPESLDEEKTFFLAEHASRISIGIQSFSQELRAILGRKSSDTAISRAIDWIGKAGFGHAACDLMYGIPGQTEENWRSDLRRLEGLCFDHVSCYALTPEENSSLGARFAIDDDTADLMYDVAEEELSRLGMRRYEVSNYAVPGCECRHNLNVWAGGLLVGVGPSASGYDGAVRMTNPPDFDAWLSGAAPEVDDIGRDARREEIFAVNLRTAAGWTPDAWAKVGCADEWKNRLERARLVAVKLPGCVNAADERISLTPRGMKFWDSVAEELLWG